MKIAIETAGPLYENIFQTDFSEKGYKSTYAVMDFFHIAHVKIHALYTCTCYKNWVIQEIGQCVCTCTVVTRLL